MDLTLTVIWPGCCAQTPGLQGAAQGGGKLCQGVGCGQCHPFMNPRIYQGRNSQTGVPRNEMALGNLEHQKKKKVLKLCTRQFGPVPADGEGSCQADPYLMDTSAEVWKLLEALAPVQKAYPGFLTRRAQVFSNTAFTHLEEGLLQSQWAQW